MKDPTGQRIYTGDVVVHFSTSRPRYTYPPHSIGVVEKIGDKKITIRTSPTTYRIVTPGRLVVVQRITPEIQVALARIRGEHATDDSK